MSGREWTAPYVGLPYRRMGRDRSGLDCWGLVRLALNEQRGLSLPLYDTIDPRDKPALEGAVEAGRHDGSWISIEETDAREFDFVRMRTRIELDGQIHWRPVHIGLVAPRRHVLHIERNETSALQPISDIRNKITEFCRHRELN
jgi:hypothetical protein